MPPMTAPAFQVVIDDDDTLYKIEALIETEIAKYIDLGYQIFSAGIGSLGDEPAQRKAAEQLRHLHYAEHIES